MSKLDKAILELGEVYDKLDELVFNREVATLRNIQDIEDLIRYLNRLVSDIENNPVL